MTTTQITDPTDGLECVCGHRGIEHDWYGRRRCLKLGCQCTRLMIATARCPAPGCTRRYRGGPDRPCCPAHGGGR